MTCHDGSKIAVVSLENAFSKAVPYPGAPQVSNILHLRRELELKWGHCLQLVFI